MKACVITVLNTRNYGTVLQTCATNKILCDCGYDVEFVDYYRKDQTILQGIKKNIRFSHRNSITKRIMVPIFALDQILRKYLFRGFLKRTVHLTAGTYNSNDDLVKNIPIADIYCTGSDQMWNSAWNEGLEKAFFLDFVPEGKVRVSFSTSIGKTSWSSEEANVTVPLLKEYTYITVRENSAKLLLNKYGVKAEVILDPTLLVPNGFWKDMVNQFSPIKEKYVFVYKLHQEHNDTDFDAYVKKIASEKGLKIKKIEYGVIEALRRRKESIYLPVPEKFINWMAHSEYVITDSFHATAFSLILKRQFSVVSPKEFSTRINNILEMTDLTYRIKTSESSPENTVIDYDLVSERLNEEREKSLHIINRIFSNVIDE